MRAYSLLLLLILYAALLPSAFGADEKSNEKTNQAQADATAVVPESASTDGSKSIPVRSESSTKKANQKDEKDGQSGGIEDDHDNRKGNDVNTQELLDETSSEGQEAKSAIDKEQKDIQNVAVKVGAADDREYTLVFVTAQLLTDPQGIDPKSAFSLGLSFPNILLGWDLKAEQGLSKGFVINEDESEFELTDTSVSFQKSVWKEGILAQYGFSNRLSLSLTLPVSKYSRDNDIISRFAAGGQTAKKWMEGRLITSFGASLAYYSSIFQSASSSDGVGGSPLPYLSFLLTQGSSYKLTDSFSIRYSFSYRETLYYDLDPTSTESELATNLPDQTYQFYLSSSYLVSEKVNIGGGFIQGNQLLRPGTADFVLYDVERSQWIVSVSFQAPFQ